MKGSTPDSTRSNPYRAALGARCDLLGPALRRFHDEGGEARGEFEVEVGAGILRRTLARLCRLHAASKAPVVVKVDAHGERQRWRRTIGRSRINSTQWARDGRLHERFGPLRFTFELRVDEGVLSYTQRRVRFLGVPLPAMFAPMVFASAYGCGPNAWMVEVEIWILALERIARYSGRMEVA